MDDLFIAFMEASDYQIEESDTMELDCFPNGRYLCAADSKGFGAMGITFNGETREVYEIIVNTESSWKGDSIAYRWLNPDVKQAARLIYAKNTGGNPDLFCDGQPYVELEVAMDAIEKGREILKGNVDYDRRIVIELDLEEEEAEAIKMAAELKGLTLDQFIEEALLRVIEETDPAAAYLLRKEGAGDPSVK